ncbi:MAG: bifunctional UDP-N-acetylglucosamine diphosphorylase/glucosamine-1-phosphate N-acetyltransferase GlmU [Alphaproteobacteria bacterium]
MQNLPLSVVILAAGMGTRMKSDLPKVMHTLAGQPMIAILIERLRAEMSPSPEKIIVVSGPEMEGLRALASAYGCDNVIQQERRGTGDAVKAALPALEGFKGNVLILLGDEPLVPIDVLAHMAAHDSPSVMAIIPPDPTGLGRVVMDEDGQLEEIVEERDCTEDQREIIVCNGGNFCVPSVKLAEWVNKIDTNNAQGEYYLTDMPKIAAEDGIGFDVFTVPIDHVWGVNDRLQLAEHERIFMDMLRDAHMLNGVRMIDPQSVYFHYDTKIAAGVLIEPSVFFGADVRVEDGVHIKAFSHIEGAHIGKNTTIGPFARLRPGSEIGEDVRVGNFVEIKKSKIGKGAKINHLAYVGDCLMGEDVNFSAGAITVNFDGFSKHETVIGKNVMIGSNVNLVAPLKIDDGAFVAAGSTITEDVPADALSIAREKGSIYKGWAHKFRDQKGKKDSAS